MKSTAILIPARYASTRLPGKPLHLLNGIPMIKRVYDAAKATARKYDDIWEVEIKSDISETFKGRKSQPAN